jgi:hypothetical protein
LNIFIHNIWIIKMGGYFSFQKVILPGIILFRVLTSARHIAKGINLICLIMKKLSKTLLGLMILSLPFVVNSNNNANAQSDYVWGTFEIIAGIAVCDGPPANCTRPAPQT